MSLGDLVSGFGARLRRSTRANTPGGEETVVRLSSLPRLERLGGRSGAPPPEYLDRFRFVALETEDKLVGRDDELAELFSAHEEWKDARRSGVAVVGAEGSGKTSLVNAFLRRLPGGTPLRRASLDTRVRDEDDMARRVALWFEIDGFRDLDDLIARVNACPSSVVTVESGHNLLLRVIGGGRGAMTFLRVMNATQERHMWLVMFRSLAWQALDQHLDAATHFNRVIDVESTSAQELREAILARHAETGLELCFEGDETGSAKGDDVFKDLVDASGGNFKAAFYFWLAGLRYERDAATVTATPLGRLDMGFVRRLDRSLLLTLVEVGSHGELSLSEHGRIFRVDGLTSRLSFDRLEQAGLVTVRVPSSDDGGPADDDGGPADDDGPHGDGSATLARERLYALSPFTYRPVVGILRQLHLLY